MKLSKLRTEIKPWMLVVGGAFIVFIFYLYNVFSTVTVVFNATVLDSVAKMGEAVELSVSVKNRSETILKNANILITLPEGVVFSNGSRDRTQRISLGEIGRNGSHDEIIRVIPLPLNRETNLRSVNLAFNYSIGTVTAKSQQKRTVYIEIEKAPIEITAEVPEVVISGEEFDLIVHYKYLGDTKSRDLKLEIEYPETFTEISVDPERNMGDVWSLGLLETGEGGEIKIRGVADFSDNAGLMITPKIITSILGKEYVIAREDIDVKVSPSPLSLIFQNEDQKTYYRPGEVVRYVLTYGNHSEGSLSDLVMRVKLTGAMYDFNSVQVKDGSFDHSTRTITWTLPPLSTNDSGSLYFNVGVLNSYPIKKVIDKNFTLRAEAKISASTNDGAKKLTNSITYENKITGMATVTALALFRDADSLILNTGTLPPRVGQATDFTVRWVLTNFGTDIKNVEVRAKLGDNVTFTSTTKSNINSLPILDPATGEVVWRIDRIYATTGITNEHPEAIFQVRANPSYSQVGNYMTLLSETTLRAVDEFTGAELVSIAEALTTRLESDKTVSEGQGRVVQ